MTTPDPPSWSARIARHGWLLWAAVGLAALIFLLHRPALRYGLFMDDYAHFRQLRDCGWSLGDLTGACRLELVGGVIDLWWMPECTLRFFRPVAFGLMKLTYVLTGWSPTAMHSASLGWHLATCLLLVVLLRRLGAERLLAWGVAALFAIHPGHVATVQWIAAQSEPMVTTLLLAALLCYMRFRGWPPASAPTPSRAAQRAWGLACVVLFTLALGCRENAVTFPLLLVASEPFARRAHPRSPLLLLLTLGLAMGVYAGLRTHYLHGAALPPRPYVLPPTDPDFARYVLDKACYYLLGEFLLVPCVPIGGLAYLRQHPLAFYGLTLIVVGVLTLLCIRNRRRPAGVLAPACLLALMLPVLPAFESPHHLYLPGTGWAIFAMLLFQWVAGPAGDPASASSGRAHAPASGADGGHGSAGAAPRSAAPRRVVALSLLGATAALFGVTSYFFTLAFDTAQAVEDQVVEEIAAAPRPVADGDTLYIANLPVIAHYVKLAVEQRTGRRDLHVVALTWSTRLLGMVTPCELVPIDERSIELRVAEDRYFSGPLQLLIRQANGGRPLAPGPDPVQHGRFAVHLLAGDERGISALRFDFRDTIRQTGVHLFWGSPTRWACQVRP